VPREEKSYFHAGDSGRRQAVCRGGSRHQTTPIPAGSENGEAFWQHTHEVAVRGLCGGAESLAGFTYPPCQYPPRNAGSWQTVCVPVWVG
jgi:hypothetical protein